MTSTPTPRSIPATIVAQLGGQGRLRAMLGADKFVTGPNWVRFSFKMCSRYNHVTVKLDEGSDLYEIEFCKIGRQWTMSNEKKMAGVCVENLIPTLERETGLAFRI